MEVKYKLLRDQKPREGDSDEEAITKITRRMEEICKQVQTVQNIGPREDFQKRLASLEKHIEVNRTNSS